MMRLFRRLGVLGLAALLVVTGAGVATAGTEGRGRDDGTATGSYNPWLHRRFLNMAHSGGEREAPMNTMYAFKRAVARGADMIELDIQSTADNHLVVTHNATVDQTTNGTGRIRDMTLRQVRALDAAYNFVPGQSAVPGLDPSAYPLRGVRTHDKRAPRGYRASDFAIPTLAEVLRTFRRVPVNIEIKGTSDDDVESFQRTGRLLADLLNRTGRRDVIVASFNDAALATFHELAPRIGMAPGRDGIIGYLGGQPLPEGIVALQVPAPIATPEFIARAHADGYAVHVWFSGTAVEDEATYNSFIDACADGLMPALPTLLERILNERHIARPGTPGRPVCR